MSDSDRVFDLALRLTAAVAANGIVAAVALAKPVGKLLGELGDRALNRAAPFDEAAAQRYLGQQWDAVADKIVSGSERLAEVEADEEVWTPFGEPDDDEIVEPLGEHPEIPLASVKLADGTMLTERLGAGHIDAIRLGRTAASAFSALDELLNLQLSAPAHSSEQVAADRPESAATADHTGGDSGPRTSENPLYADLQIMADAAVIADVLAGHSFRFADMASIGPQPYCSCGIRPQNIGEWRRHVSRLIAQELQK